MSQNLVVQLLLKTGTFSTDLKTAKGQIQDFQKGCTTAGKSLDAFGKSIGIDIGSLVKFGGAIGAAAAAGKIFKSVIDSTQTSSDAFEGAIAGCKGVVDSLMTSIASANFSTFENGLWAVFDAAKAARDALDDLQDAQLGYNRFTIQNRRTSAEAKDVVYDPDSTPEQVAAAIEKWEAAVAEEEKNVGEYGQKLLNSLRAQVAQKNTFINEKDVTIALVDEALKIMRGPNSETDKEQIKIKAKNLLKEKYATNTKKKEYLDTKQRELILAVLVDMKDDLLKSVVDEANAIDAAHLNLSGMKLELSRGKKRAANRNRPSGGKSSSSSSSTTEEDFEPGTMGFYEQQKLKVSKEYKLAKTYEDTQKVDAKIAEIQKKIDLITNGQKEENEELILTKKYWQDIIQENEELLNVKPKGSDAYNDALDKIKEAKQVLVGWDLADALSVKPPTLNSLNAAKRLIEEMIGDIAIGSKQFEFWQGRIKLIEKKLKEASGEVAEAPKTDTWDTFNQSMSNTATIVSSLANTFKDSSEVTASSVLQMVATCLPAIGSLISSISALTAVEAVEAGVGAVGKAVSSSKHWIEAIAAVASLGAVVAAAIGSAKSQGQKFANGGIVGGNSFTGDRVSANVNSGEMILNRSQQTRLFRMANGSGNGGGQVEFHISGTDLIGVLNNQNRKNRIIG